MHWFQQLNNIDFSFHSFWFALSTSYMLIHTFTYPACFFDIVLGLFIVTWLCPGFNNFFLFPYRSFSFFHFNKPMTERNQRNFFELMILIVCTRWRKNSLITKVLENREKKRILCRKRKQSIWYRNGAGNYYATLIIKCIMHN